MNTVLEWGQLVSIVGFIVTLFVLYRVYVQQKDATIQLLKEKSEWLNNQLEVAKQESSDILLKKLNERVQIANAEIERLSKDKESMETIQGSAKNIIKSQVNMINAQRDLIVALKNKLDAVENHHRKTRQLIDDYIANAEKSSTDTDSLKQNTADS